MARWARELREALDGRDEEVTDVATIRQDAMEAYEWVEAHDGLDAVKRLWECLSYYVDPVPRACMERRLASRQRQIDESHAALRRRNERIAELEHERDELREMVRSLNALTDEMEKRLMPEGMEWPMWEDGKPVTSEDAPDDAIGVFLSLDGSCWAPMDITPDGWLESGERVERPDSLDRLAEDIGAMVVAWHSNQDLFDAQESAAGCVGENTLGAALDSLARRAKALAGVK